MSIYGTNIVFKIRACQVKDGRSYFTVGLGADFRLSSGQFDARILALEPEKSASAWCWTGTRSTRPGVFFACAAARPGLVFGQFPGGKLEMED
jgi:hypothetical protein